MSTDQKKLAVYLPADLEAEVRAAVEREGRTITGLVRMLLRQYLAAKP